MKIIFTLVSFIALTYLIVQTQFVQTNINQWFNSVNEAAPPNDNKPVVEEGAVLTHAANTLKTDTQNTVIKKKLQTLETNNQSLQSKVTRLEKQVKMLAQSTVISNHKVAQLQNSEVANPSMHNSETFSATSDIASVIEVNRSNMDDKFSQALAPSNDSNKRLQQQAILRELAQKMELAAISSLRP